MKSMIVILAALLAAPLSFAQSEEIIVSRDWRGDIVTQHDVWAEPACVASTMGDDELSRLEILALGTQEQGYLEPFIQVVSPIGDIFLSIKAETDRSNQIFELLPLFPENSQSENMVAISQISDREALIDAIKQKNRLVATFMDAQGEVKSVRFSLRGSSKAVSETFRTCSLGFTDLPEADLN